MKDAMVLRNGLAPYIYTSVRKAYGMFLHRVASPDSIATFALTEAILMKVFSHLTLLRTFDFTLRVTLLSIGHA